MSDEDDDVKAELCGETPLSPSLEAAFLITMRQIHALGIEFDPAYLARIREEKRLSLLEFPVKVAPFGEEEVEVSCKGFRLVVCVHGAIALATQLLEVVKGLHCDGYRHGEANTMFSSIGPGGGKSPLEELQELTERVKKTRMEKRPSNG